MKQQLKKIIYILLAVSFVILGIIGIFLPILPTTPFLILAVYFSVGSCPTLHNLLLNNKYFGGDLQRWEREKTVKKETKIKSMFLIVASFTVSIIIVHPRIELQIMLLSLCFISLTLVWRLKEKSRIN